MHAAAALAAAAAQVPVVSPVLPPLFSTPHARTGRYYPLPGAPGAANLRKAAACAAAAPTAALGRAHWSARRRLSALSTPGRVQMERKRVRCAPGLDVATGRLA